MEVYHITTKPNERKEIKEYKRELAQISGRFHKVYEDAKKIVVGALGTMSMRRLTESQYRYVVGFYQQNPDLAKATVICLFPVSINQSMYNDFLIIEKAVLFDADVL